MSEIEMIPERKAIRLHCKRCGHNWLYTGRGPYYASCPICRSSIKINGKREEQTEQKDRKKIPRTALQEVGSFDGQSMIVKPKSTRKRDSSYE